MTSYYSDLVLRDRKLSHSTFEEIVGQGANKQVPRAWLIPDDTSIGKIAIHKDQSGLVFYSIVSDYPLPSDLTACRYSSELKAAEIVNAWLATRAAEALKPQEAQPTSKKK